MLRIVRNTRSSARGNTPGHAQRASSGQFQPGSGARNGSEKQRFPAIWRAFPAFSWCELRIDSVPFTMTLEFYRQKPDFGNKNPEKNIIKPKAQAIPPRDVSLCLANKAKRPGQGPDQDKPDPSRSKTLPARPGISAALEASAMALMGNSAPVWVVSTPLRIRSAISRNKRSD